MYSVQWELLPGTGGAGLKVTSSLPEEHKVNKYAIRGYNLSNRCLLFSLMVIPHLIGECWLGFPMLKVGGCVFSSTNKVRKAGTRSVNKITAENFMYRQDITVLTLQLRKKNWLCCLNNFQKLFLQ